MYDYLLDRAPESIHAIMICTTQSAMADIVPVTYVIIWMVLN